MGCLLKGWTHKNPRHAGLLFAILTGCVLAGCALRGFAWEELTEYLKFAFIQRALLVGSLVALCAALLGVILVLKQYSMIGDGLSHMGFGAITMALALGNIQKETLPGPAGEAVWRLFQSVADAPMIFTLGIVSVCAILLLRVSRNSALRGDSAIALISTSSLALGVILSSTVRGMNIDVTNYLFGSILAVQETDVALSLLICFAVLLLFVLFRPKIFAVTFDEAFAAASGVNTGLYNTLIAILTAMTIVVGMRLMGSMLISSLILFPALSAMRLFSSFRGVMMCSALVSVGCFVVGLMLACLCSMPAGAGIVAVNLLVYLLFTAVSNLRSR